MKYSRQRELIEETVKLNRIHPTAEDIYSILKPDNPNLSLGTVYRNLNNLASCGIILKIETPDGKAHFDGDISEHSHAICEKCGKIYDIILPEMKEIDRIVNERNEIKITSHQLIFNCVCNKCKEN